MSAKTPLAPDDADRRSAWDRIPRHLIVAGSSWMGRIVSAAVQLVSVRLLLSSLGLENYAAFALLVALQGWLLLADLGVGASTQNHLSEARARGEPVEGILATARLLALGLLVVMIGLLYLTSPFVAPAFLKTASTLSDAEKVRLFFVTGAMSIGFGVGGIVYKIWYAQQRGYLSNIVPAVAAILGLVGISLAGRMAPEDRLMYSLVAFVGPTAALPLGTLVAQMLRDMRRARADGVAAQPVLRWRDIARRSVGFWVFALMGAVTLQIDYVVLSQALGPRDIATYSLVTKVFGLVFFVYNALILALWPVFTELIIKQRWDEVRAYLRNYITIGALFVAACTVSLVWLMPHVIGLLTPDQAIVVPTRLILLTGAYWIVRVWTDTFSMLLQSMNRIKPFLILVPVQAALSGLLQWVLVPRFGLPGILLGLIASFVLTVSWGLPVAAARHFANATRRTP